MLRPHCWIWLTMPACVLLFQQILPGGEKPFWNKASIRTLQTISCDTICLKSFSGHGLSVLSQEFFPSQMNHPIQTNTQEEGHCPETHTKCCPLTEPHPSWDSGTDEQGNLPSKLSVRQSTSYSQHSVTCLWCIFKAPSKWILIWMVLPFVFPNWFKVAN